MDLPAETTPDFVECFDLLTSIDDLINSAAASSFVLAPRNNVPSAWYGHVPFAYWIVASLQPQLLVELGTHNGVSYSAFCDAVLHGRLSTSCFAIDTWEGDEHAGYYGENVLQDFQAFHDSRYSQFSQLLRSTFDAANGYFSEGSVDLIHIDGCHTYDAVRRDFETWLPKLSSKAVVLFHDINVRENGFGVWQFWAEIKNTYPNFEFVHEHGLGVLVVGNTVPEVVLQLCGLSKTADIARVRTWFSFNGRACILEAEVVQHRMQALAETATRIEFERIETIARNEAQQNKTAACKEVNRLRGELNDTHLLAQNIADTRDAALAQCQVTLSDLASARTTLITLDERLHAASNEILRISAVAQTFATGLTVAYAQAHSPQHAALAYHSHEKHEFQRRIFQLTQDIEAMERSTMWRMTKPLRHMAKRVPVQLRKPIRRAIKAGWWLLTPQRIPERLRLRAQMRQSWLPSHLSAATPFPLAGSRALQISQIPAAHVDFRKAIDWYDSLAPEVSIIILNWNRSDMTSLCLQYLWKHTAGYRYEIIVVDNGSDHGEIQQLRGMDGLFKIIMLGTNRYFGEANNIGAEAASGKYICFLNNDAFVHANWLAPLIDLIKADPTTGAVGPCFLYPDGRLQEAGALVMGNGAITQLGKGQAPYSPRFSSVQTVDYVSAACLLMRKTDFLRVLGFDLAWDPAYYEDVDLCLKLRLEGLYTLYCPHSTVTHIENATSSDTSHGLALNNIVAINRAKFSARWETFLTTDEQVRPNLFPSTSPKMLKKESGLPRLVIFTPYNITPGGGERYILTIAEAFRDLAEVVLVTPRPYSRTRILTMGRDFRLELDHIEMVEFDKLSEQKPFDLAFVLGNHIYPSIGRIAKRNIYICQFPFPIENANTAAEMRTHWNDYDLIITYSAFVHRHVSRLIESLDLPKRAIEILCPPVVLLPADGQKHAQILHVGRFFTGGHCKRQDVLIEAFRQIIAAGVKAELHLAGSIHPEPEHRAYYAALVESAAGLPIFFHANCSADELKDLYAKSQVYWHATGFGHDVDVEPHTTEHFGISVVEAMSAGCIPVVLGVGGPAEVVKNGVTGYHFQKIEELCSITTKLLQDPSSPQVQAMIKEMMTSALSFGQELFQERTRQIAIRFMKL